MPAIMTQRLEAANHPFDFKPFHPIGEKDVQRVLPFARKGIERYRDAAWERPQGAKRLLGGLWRMVRGKA
jgi:hypothetical protein